MKFLATRIMCLVVVLGMFFSSLMSQNVHTVPVRYEPEGDGFAFSVDFQYKFMICGGEVYLTYGFSSASAKGTYFRLKGEKYSLSEIQHEFNFSSDVSCTAVEADVYFQSSYLGHVRMTNIVNLLTGCYGDGFWLFQRLVRPEEDKHYRNKLDGFRLSNVAFTFSPDMYGAARRRADAYEENKKLEEANELVSRARALESSGALKEALELFEEAIAKAPRNEAAKEGKKRVAEKIKEEVERQREEERKEEEERDAVGGESSGGTGGIRLSSSGGQKKSEGDSGKKEKKKEDKKDEKSDSLGRAAYARRHTTGSYPGYGTYRSQEEAEEFNRRQRKYMYDMEMTRARAANYQAATQMAEGMAKLIVYTVGLVYNGVGNDRPINRFRGDSWFWGLELGYGTTLAPMLVNTNTSYYDGNNYGSTNKVEDHENWTIDFKLNGEFWPVYGDNHGFGVFGGVGGGLNLIFEGTLLEAQYGFRGFLGKNWLKFYGEYGRGTREHNHDSFWDPEIRSEGVSSYDYQRIRVGPRFSFPGKYKGESRFHLDVQPLFELPDLKKSVQSAGGNLAAEWASGLHLGLWMENRLRLYLEVIWNQPRMGEKLSGPQSGTTDRGTYFSLGIMRRFDFFGNSGFQSGIEKIRSLQAARTKVILSFLNPGFEWAISTYPFENAGFNANLSPVWFELEHRLFPWLTADIGASFSFMRGMKLRSEEGFAWNNGNVYPGAQLEWSAIGADIPMGLRIWIPVFGVSRYWLSGQYVHRFTFEGEINKIGVFVSELESQIPVYHSVLRFGAGTDVSLNDKVAIRLGGYYSHQLNELLPGIQPVGFNVQSGVVFKVSK